MMGVIGLTLDVENRLIVSYKTEAHAYLRLKHYKVPTPSHSLPIYVHLGQDLIYHEGKGYFGAIPNYGEQWFTKEGKPLEISYEAINITERALDDMIEVVVHETYEIGLPKVVSYDRTFLDMGYYQKEKLLEDLVPRVVKDTTHGALLRFKGYYLQSILYYYGKEKHDLFDTVSTHFGVFMRLFEASRLIKEKFPRVKLLDDKRLSKFSKTKAILTFQVARQGGYYFNRIAERVENPPEIFVDYEGERMKLGDEEALGNDAALRDILKDANNFRQWKKRMEKRLKVRFRDEPFWKY